VNKIMFEEMKDLTKKLVSIPSINGSRGGEAAIADFIYQYIADMPYFRNHSGDVFVQNIAKDSLGRKNVFALLRGTKGKSRKTLLFHGHIDTVGVDDLGVLKEVAFDCDRLAEEMKKLPQDTEVRHDLESGDYLFGRGASDMKSGDAVFLILLKHLSLQPEQIDGNILFMFNPVEENHHTGILAALQTLLDLREQEGLDYIFAVNNDYICPLYAGDTTRYIYTGAMGKILPSFYVLGKETHVGQCYEGVSAAGIASRIVHAIDLNPALCDTYDGECSLPPVVLKMKDLKPRYDVQTIREALVYFSYMVEDDDMGNVLFKLKDIARKTLTEVLQQQEKKANMYSKISGSSQRALQFEGHVYLFEELMQRALRQGISDMPQVLENIAAKEQEAGSDAREISLMAVRELCRRLNVSAPIVVIFLSPPYLPHNTLHSNNSAELELMEGIGNIAASVGKETGETFEMLHFFPSLSDSSYLKIDDSQESVDELIHNFPLYHTLFPVPTDMIRQLSIPSINYGCFGKDAHRKTERVYMPYSFGVLPELIMQTIYNYL